MSTLYYLAYGSNLHPLRLTERLPSARLLGPVELPGYRLAFHKRGEDDSGKGNLLPADEMTAVGALFEIAAAERPALDRFEGEGYGVCDIRVTHAGVTYDCFTYMAEHTHVDDDLKPYDWYKALILLGAMYHRAPAPYLHMIRAVEAISDPDEQRRQRHQALIARIEAANRALLASPS